jgi:hypothetical protein
MSALPFAVGRSDRGSSRRSSENKTEPGHLSASGLHCLWTSGVGSFGPIRMVARATDKRQSPVWRSCNVASVRDLRPVTGYERRRHAIDRRGVGWTARVVWVLQALRGVGSHGLRARKRRAQLGNHAWTRRRDAGCGAGGVGSLRVPAERAGSRRPGRGASLDRVGRVLRLRGLRAAAHGPTSPLTPREAPRDRPGRGYR